MTIIFRGVQNSLRSPLRAVIATVLLALSTALIVSMLIANDSFTAVMAAEGARSGSNVLQISIDRSYGTMIAGVIATVGLVMLTFITIIREQRHEIGVIKAIGGGTAAIIAQFIVEVSLLTFAGLFVGTVMGTLMSPHATYFLSTYHDTIVPIIILGDVYIQTIGLTIAAIFAGSLFPAVLIAMIRPIEATRVG